MINVIGPSGQPAMQALPTNPIEFIRGKYVAKDQETIDFLESHNAFGKDFHALPTERELQEKKEEARKADIARARALLAEVEGDEDQAPDENPKPEDEEFDGDSGTGGQGSVGYPIVLSDVSSKTEALEALADAGANMDFAKQRPKNADIVDEARKQGFAFDGWPS